MSAEARAGPTPLYERLLGPAWGDLDEAVRRFHDGAVRASGTFRVRRGTSRLARLLANLGRMPAESEAVGVALAVVPRGSGEEWRRSFGGRPLVSRQWARPDGLLGERMGLSELAFRLSAEGGALVSRGERTFFRLGPFRCLLPDRLAPIISTREEQADGPDQLRITVEVNLPGRGLLIAYGGLLTLAGGPT